MSEEGAQPIAVVGAGSWGTALAIQLARQGSPTRLWGRNAERMARLAAERENRDYLPGCPFPESLVPHADLDEAVADCRDILVAVPSAGFRQLLEQLRDRLPADARLAWATKGFELDTGRLPEAVAREVLGEAVPLAVVSGPTFAREVGRGLPAGVTVASADGAFAHDLAVRLHSGGFRAYTSGDVTGVEVGGAVKNVLAIAVGVADGLSCGANTRAVLITRGLHEMMRLGGGLGADPETLMGLSGMGDLVLTCTDDQSRNRRTGLAVAAGRTVAEIAEEIGQVVEGVRAARAVYEVARAREVHMPITEHVYRVLHEGLSPTDAVLSLASGEPKPERL